MTKTITAQTLGSKNRQAAITAAYVNDSAVDRLNMTVATRFAPQPSPLPSKFPINVAPATEIPNGALNTSCTTLDAMLLTDRGRDPMLPAMNPTTSNSHHSKHRTNAGMEGPTTKGSQKPQPELQSGKQRTSRNTKLQVLPQLMTCALANS
jgi:hypothetical protein